MLQLTIRDLSFTHEGSYTPVFDRLTVQLDTSWRLGLIARNGRGKTTLLHLLEGRYTYQGSINCPLLPVYFPFSVPDQGLRALEVAQQCAPESAAWQLERELRLLRVPEDGLERPFATLSQGEQTKVLLAALFSREDVYPLIDEPTNHLDVHGRQQVADYLRRKDGFLLVSHDRAFLNRCVDHVLSLNRADVWVMQGDYDAWEERLRLHNETEQARNEELQRDIKRLEASARRTAAWSNQAEKGKFHVSPSEVAAVDRGYVGAKAAAVMKRSQSTLRRREKALEEKRSLLHNVEQVGTLKLPVLHHPKDVLVSVQNGCIAYDACVIQEGMTFVLRRGDRMAITGSNGSGKSSLLRALAGDGGALQGRVALASGLQISYVPQRIDMLRGSLRTFIEKAGVDETLFKAILRNMDFSRELFDLSLEQMSQGQKKKVLLARSLCTPAHLYIWDEPLNYIDVYSRIQLEQLLVQSQPTLLLVEHDARFLERVCNCPEAHLATRS